MRALLIAVFLVPLVLQVSKPAYGHGLAQWIMRDPNTNWCCGPKDCRALERVDDKVEVIDGLWHVNGQPVPREHVYPARGQTEYWACFWPPEYTVPRCLFVPGES